MPPIRLAFALILAAFPHALVAQEFRALWADTFHAGLRNSTETSALIAAARAANCNAVVVEVRKRGDAYYRNGLEPVATDVAAGFDPLADLIAKGHDTAGGNARIDVHAWIVTYNIWNNETTNPSQPTHPYNLHADWLTENSAGDTWVGPLGGSGNYMFDPGHPAVQQHTFNVCMDIITRYDVDGLHFDYVRYPDYNSSGNNQPWGYNPVTIARYQKLTATTATPSATNAAYLQWRRDQVTALVRKVYLNTWALKPNVRVSAATIVYGNAPASWTSSEAYARVLQDWRAWMQEGILDLTCPMIYGSDNARFTGWANFTKDNQNSRAGAMGMGWYLNTLSNTNTQIGLARATSPGGKTGAGVLGYSYAVPNLNNAESQSASWASLVANSFPSAVPVPAMPWKTNSTKGHLMGTALAAVGGAAFDGATITLTGPVNRTFLSDATGFFGAVDLPVGVYTLTLNLPGYQPITRTFAVNGATVAQQPLSVAEKPFIITNVVRNVPAGTLLITWNSVPGRTYRVEKSDTLTGWGPVASGIVAAASGSNTHQWTIPGNQGPKAFLRVVQE